MFFKSLSFCNIKQILLTGFNENLSNYKTTVKVNSSINNSATPSAGPARGPEKGGGEEITQPNIEGV